MSAIVARKSHQKMATLKAVVQKDKKRKDGTYNIKIRLTHKRETRWIPTAIDVDEKDVTKGGRIKNRTALIKINETINGYERAISEIKPFELEGMTAADLVGFLRKTETTEQEDEFKLNFLQWGEEEAKKRKPGTRMVWMTALNAFRRFAGGDMDINDITKRTARCFIEFIKNEQRIHYPELKRNKKTGRRKKGEPEKKAWRVYCQTLRSIHTRAKTAFNDEDAGHVPIPRDPFSVTSEYKYKTEGKQSIGKETMQMLIDTEAASNDPRERWALCTLILSFGLCGMNNADMAEAPAPTDGFLEYSRKKTRDRRRDGAPMRVKILPELEYYLGVLTDGKKLLAGFKGDGTIVSIRQRYTTDKITAAAGLPRICSYSIRHTWATLARSSECRISHDTIDECLCHAAKNPLVDVYAEKDWRNVWDAQEKVISLFTWPRLGQPFPSSPICPESSRRRGPLKNSEKRAGRMRPRKKTTLPSRQRSKKSVENAESQNTTEATTV